MSPVVRMAREDVNLRDTARIDEKIRKRVEQGIPFFSFEYFPPKTAVGVENLYDRVDRMAKLEPLFCDMTWGAGGSTSDLTLDLSGNIQKYVGLDCCMHLTCTNMPVEKVNLGLEQAQARGIRNILALRGDPPAGQEWQACDGGFEHGSDLVRYIRQNYGEYFGIGVAGYPEGHPAGLLDGKLTYDQELQYLKDKVDLGANFIVTQMFYDVDVFLKFVRDARDIGISIPILPGILPIQNYAGFKRMTGFCKTAVPQHVTDALEPIKDDDAAVKRYGIKLGVQMCRKILDSGLAPGIHFYSLNLEKSVIAILTELGLVPQHQAIRSLPWRPVTLDKRRTEDVRPIFWANRPKSYLNRTAEWDEFPNGRWGNNQSPAYGDLTDYHLVGNAGFINPEAKQQYLDLIGPVESIEDVSSVFVRFCNGDIKRLPWMESDAMASETRMIMGPLVWLNQNGLWTINSQPRVNAAPSSDHTVGWGGAGGYVYQKAYVEFFASEQTVNALMELAPKYPSLTMYSVTKAATEVRSTQKSAHTNAVTWGVFPDREIVQPTVVDPSSFMAWKQEAFDLWSSSWASLYPEDSPSRKLLDSVADTYHLVTVVDNDFVAGDIFKIFGPLINKGEAH